MIRVLSIIHYPVFGGPHNRNARVAQFLKHEGVEITVLLPDEAGNAAERLRQAGVQVVEIPLSRIRAKLNPIYHLRLFAQFLGDVGRIRRIIRERNINLVQINGLVNPQGAIAAQLEKVPVVWQILDTYPPMLLRRLIMPMVRRMADVLMCTGRRVSEEHPGSTLFGNRLVHFYPPVDLERFKPNPELRKCARQKLGLTDDAFVIGNVGNINLQKGHRTFVRAAGRLREQIAEVRFVILGALHENHRAYAEGLWKEATGLGLSKGEDLIVRDPGTDVADLEPAFDIFWMTSEPRSEGVPTVIEEAMALGIPVVATRAGSIAEIVLDGKTGFVVAPYDIEGLVERTLQLYADENLRQTMGDAAGAFAVHNFGIEDCALTLLHAYMLAIGHGGGRVAGSEVREGH